MERDYIYAHVEHELNKAYLKHGTEQWGRHEFYAILLEEVEEAWDVIKADGSSGDLQSELIQIIAMVVRYMETGNRYSNYL